MNLKPFALSLALLAITLPAPAQAQEGGDGGGKDVRVAMASPSRIFAAMRETKDLQQNLESEGVRLRAMEQEKKTEIQKLQDKRNQYKADSAEWDKANDALLNAVTDFDAWGKITKAKAERHQKRQMKHLFEQIEAAIAEVAQRDGFDLVVADQRPELPENLDQVNFDQLRALINSRNVLYASAKADLSDEVIALLDAKYKGKGAAAPAAGPGGAAVPTAATTPGAGAPTRKPAAAPARQGNAAGGAQE